MEIKSGIIIALITLAVSISSLGAEEKVNLLKNGTFSDGSGKYTPGWTFSFWMLKKGTPEAAASKYGIVKEEKNEKNKYLMLSTTKAIKAQIWFQQQIECEPGQTYKLTFKVKGSFSERKWGNPDCGIYLMDEDSNWLVYKKPEDLKITPEWTSYSLTVKAPDNAEKLGVRMGLGGIGIFNVYFDDIKLVQVNE